MIVVLYIATVVIFCIAAQIAPILFSPLTWAYRSITGEEVTPTNPVYISTCVLGTLLLTFATSYVWQSLGYKVGWLLIVILILLHLLFGSAAGANKVNQVQSFSTVAGLVIFGLLLAV